MSSKSKDKNKKNFTAIKIIPEKKYLNPVICELIDKTWYINGKHPVEFLFSIYSECPGFGFSPTAISPNYKYWGVAYAIKKFTQHWNLYECDPFGLYWLRMIFVHIEAAKASFYYEHTEGNEKQKWKASDEAVNEFRLKWDYR